MNGGNGADATIITANEFYVPAGIHWSGGGANLTVEQNYGEGIVGQFIEIQGAPTSLIVQDNDYAKPNTSIQNGSKYAYSIPVQDGINPIVRRNRAISPKEAAGIFATLMMIEAGGKNLDCSDNYLVGGRNVIAVDGSNATGKVHDNRISDFTNAPYNANNATATFNNNTPTTQLTWDMARPRPARFSRYGTTPVPPIPVFRWPPTINMTAPGTQPADYDLRKQ
jgi:hypothetical protein